MKTLIMAVGIVAVLALLVFGGEKTWSYLKGGRQVINEEVDKNSPMPLEAARVKSLVDTEANRILEYEDKVADLQARANSAERTIQDLGQKVESETVLLKKIKGMLELKQEKYNIGGRSYTFAEVNADALARLESVRGMQESIRLQESLLTDLEKAAKTGIGNLAVARKNQMELTNKISQLEARNSNADLKMEVANLTGAVGSSPFSPSSELEKSFRNYETRVAQKERRAESRLTMSAGNSGAPKIDYSTSVVTQDASKEISSFLEGGAPPRADDTAKLEEPSTPLTSPSLPTSISLTSPPRLPIAQNQ